MPGVEAPQRRGARPGSTHAGTVIEPARAWVDARPWVIDLAIIAGVTAIAAGLRLWALGTVPFGVHPDEAQVALDARRVLDDGWIGVYSRSALGVPTLNAYITTPAVWIFGSTAFAMRIGMTLAGLAAVPLTYALVRILYARTEATFAALLLAVSYWHVFYSRVAHSSITYPTVYLAALLCLAMGVRTGRTGWWLAGGGLLGFGVYAYNVAPIVFVTTAAWFGLMWLVWWRPGAATDAAACVARLAPRAWIERVALALVAAVVVALPFLIYIASPDAYFWEHIEDYSRVSITRAPEFQEASVFGKGRIMAEQARDFAATYAWDGREDLIDAMGTRPVFEPLMLLLLGAGAIAAWPRRREPMVLLAACGVLILPLPALTQTESMMRQPLAAAPFAMFFAALPLAALWRMTARGNGRWRALPAAAAIGCVAIIAGTTVRDYFARWDGHALTRYVYHEEITAAARYIDDLPDGSYVYFYSERHPLYLETVTYLAPDVAGEDRSAEFGPGRVSLEDIDERNGVIVLIGEYLRLANNVRVRYPGSVERAGYHDGELMFLAYELGGTLVRRP
jgi:4-amino-4-deoxy-L-arabinose transferase-like glycosyltransferase